MGPLTWLTDHPNHPRPQAFTPKVHNRLPPVCNPTLAAKWDQMEHRRHRRTVKEMRSISDFSPPSNNSPLGDDRVAAMRRNARAHDIEMGNARLLHNITSIMRRPPGSAHGAREWNTRKGVAMRFVSTRIDSLDPSQPNGYSPAGTMNSSLRLRQLAEIDAENRSLLARMQATRPTYDAAALELDFDIRQQRCGSCTRTDWRNAPPSLPLASRRPLFLFVPLSSGNVCALPLPLPRRREHTRRASGPNLPAYIASTQAAWPVASPTLRSLPRSRSLPEGLLDLPWSPLDAIDASSPGGASAATAAAMIAPTPSLRGAGAGGAAALQFDTPAATSFEVPVNASFITTGGGGGGGGLGGPPPEVLVAIEPTALGAPHAADVKIIQREVTLERVGGEMVEVNRDEPFFTTEP